MVCALWLPAAHVRAADTPTNGSLSANSDRLRIATYNVNLTRRGPGLLLRDILSGTNDQVHDIAAVIAKVSPDVLLLTKVDYDHGLAALHALADLVEERGAPYPHRFALPPNAGMQTGLDMDGDGRMGTADDAQGYGPFAGAAGMALLSRLPVAYEDLRDFSGFLWRDLPGALIPEADGAPFPSAEVFDIQRLSSTGHWEVPLTLTDGGRLHLLAFHASPPVFGGPFERNLLRNHDEVRFWSLFLDGALPMAPPEAPFVLLGDSNLDPWDGDGMSGAMRDLLDHPALHDPRPGSAGGVQAATGPVNATHRGDPALDTTQWLRDIGPGNLRVDYVLPATGMQVLDAGVFWPETGDPLHALLGRDGEGGSRHRLVWVDVALPLR